MSLRSLTTEIMFQDKATQALQDVNTEMDDIRDSVEGTKDDFSDLTYDTNEFAYSARSDMQDVGSSVDEVGHKAGTFRDRMGRAADSIKRNWTKIAAGVAAAGAAIEGVIRKNRELELQTERTALMLGEESDVLRDRIVEQTDHTFSVEDNLRARQRLLQMGYDEMDVQDELVEQFDKLADATGEDIVAAIDMAFYALHGLGGSLEDTGDYLDTFTWIQTETMAEMRDLERLIRYLGDDFQDMGMTVDDLAIMLGAMGENAQLGSGMMQRFRDAMDDGEQSTEEYMKALGLTDDELEKQMSSLREAEGRTRELADAYGDSYTWLQKQQEELQKLNYQYGDLIGTLDFLSPALMGLGTAMGIAAGAKYLFGGAATAVVAALGAVTAPIWVVVGLVFTLGAALGWLVFNWDETIEWIKDAQDRLNRWWIDRLNSIIDFIAGIDLFDIGRAMIAGLVEGIRSYISNVQGVVTSVGETIRGGFESFFGISSPSELMMDYGVNLGEGLNIGFEDEAQDFFSRARRMFQPEREQEQMQVAGAGAYSPTVNITVNGSDGPEQTADAVDRRLRQTFEQHANRYFSRQRRRR